VNAAHALPQCTPTIQSVSPPTIFERANCAAASAVYTEKNNGEAFVKSLNTVIILAMAFGRGARLGADPGPCCPGSGASPCPSDEWWSQAGGESGPEALSGRAEDAGDALHGVNKPIWHIADILSRITDRRAGNRKWFLTRDFDGRYVQMAPGDKAKCIFYADDASSLGL